MSLSLVVHCNGLWLTFLASKRLFTVVISDEAIINSRFDAIVTHLIWRSSHTYRCLVVCGPRYPKRQYGKPFEMCHLRKPFRSIVHEPKAQSSEAVSSIFDLALCLMQRGVGCSFRCGRFCTGRGVAAVLIEASILLGLAQRLWA